jgi:hypothetical protein
LETKTFGTIIFGSREGPGFHASAEHGYAISMLNRGRRLAAVRQRGSAKLWRVRKYRESEKAAGRPPSELLERVGAMAQKLRC